jgi:hypothetical protein
MQRQTEQQSQQSEARGQVRCYAETTAAMHLLEQLDVQLLLVLGALLLLLPERSC